MSANVRTVSVPTREQMRQAVMSYVAQGFVVSTQDEDSATMFKKKEFSIVWAIVGLFLCFLPLLIYLIIYVTQSDEMVVIRVVGQAQPAELSSVAVESLTWSEDRNYWWDGKAWIDAARTPPATAVWSESGTQWWDGKAWRNHATAQLEATEEPPATD
jgi:hypothetical protein